MDLTKMIQNRIYRATLEAPSMDSNQLIFALESTTAQITRISMEDTTEDEVAAELYLNEQLRLIYRSELNNRLTRVG